MFVCSQNKLRSPTAEQVFASRTDIGVSSAGINHDAENPVTPDELAWADIIVVMERAHRNKLQSALAGICTAGIVCLGIPDDYEFMDPDLIALLEARMARHLPSVFPAEPPAIPRS
ncbi:phosphotyrosine protein phosphatase [Sphingomonas sp. G-3-2-10]|uniref:low molecular weight protein tyrosine phosphatase family protein n=1 Tax=Sphingomonas sp. G-3-2-10 TaxID=2728838 RepID=UPI003217C292